MHSEAKEIQGEEISITGRDGSHPARAPMDWGWPVPGLAALGMGAF